MPPMSTQNTHIHIDCTAILNITVRLHNYMTEQLHNYCVSYVYDYITKLTQLLGYTTSHLNKDTFSYILYITRDHGCNEALRLYKNLQVPWQHSNIHFNVNFESSYIKRQAIDCASWNE